jgi:hypothetical protein
VASSILNAIRKSLFFDDTDRLNVIIYGNNTTYYSLGIEGAGDYVVQFPPDIKVQVPGGYGYYRIGALGKLISWDKKPAILKRTFSLATYSLDDYYFYTDTNDVFFGSDTPNVALPQAKDIFFSNSNASFLDRLYILMTFLNRKLNDFKYIHTPINKNRQGDLIFDDDTYEKKYLGYLYEKTYRNEMKSVQILYTKDYANGARIGKMLEGNGIRVGDISQLDSPPKKCTVVENSSEISLTARRLMSFFNCVHVKGKTDIYDILFQLGDKESEWEINE